MKMPFSKDEEKVTSAEAEAALAPFVRLGKALEHAGKLVAFVRQQEQLGKELQDRVTKARQEAEKAEDDAAKACSAALDRVQTANGEAAQAERDSKSRIQKARDAEAVKVQEIQKTADATRAREDRLAEERQRTLDSLQAGIVAAQKEHDDITKKLEKVRAERDAVLKA